MRKISIEGEFMRRQSKWAIRSAAALMACTLLVTALPKYSSVHAADSSCSDGGTTAEIRKEYTNTTQVVEKLTKNLVSFYGETSVQYAIIDHGEITVCGANGYAVKEKKKAPEKSTMYGIASISKMYTAAAVMKLAEEGRIDLGQPVVTYLPEFKMADPRYKKITVRMLLNHSSGLPGGNLTNAVQYGALNQTATDGFLESLSRQRLITNPGEFSVYCNDGFTLAELLVEKVTGKEFTTYLHQNLLSPMELRNTYTAGEHFVTRRLARSYNVDNQLQPYENFTMIGTGGIYSTASDVCRFAQIFMEHNDQIISEESKQQMMQPEYLKGIWNPEDEDSVYTFGLGWDQVYSTRFREYKIKALIKGGDSKEYHSSLIVLPQEEMAMVILSVGGTSVHNKLAGEEVLLSYLEEKGKIDRSKEKKTIMMDLTQEVQSMPKKYREYSGYYANNQSVIKIRVHDEVMTIENPVDHSSYDVKYYRNGWFVEKESKQYFSFRKEANGNIYLYQKQIVQIPGIGEQRIGLYCLQKLQEYPVNCETIKVWEKRLGKSYFLVNERYSSCIYSSDLVQIKFDKNQEFYLGSYLENNLIVDGTTTQNLLQIPMELGRDLTEMRVEQVNEIEYIWKNNYHFIDKSSIEKLPNGMVVRVSVPENGEGIYYEVPESLDGKTVQIEVPKHASCIIYDNNQKLVMNTYLSKNNKVTLTAGGYFLFVGDALSKFTISVCE